MLPLEGLLGLWLHAGRIEMLLVLIKQFSKRPGYLVEPIKLVHILLQLHFLAQRVGRAMTERNQYRHFSRGHLGKVQ